VTPPFTPELSSALRLIVQFDPEPKGYMVLSSGQNEYFLSKHYTDMTDMWMQNEYFCLEEEKTQYEMVLNPD
jgi:acyl-homoserine lactone acylase PvdQ